MKKANRKRKIDAPHIRISSHRQEERKTMISLKNSTRMVSILVFSVIVAFHGSASGWHDETHLAVAKAAGYAKWYNAAGADMAKIKADRIEKNNHYCNNPERREITPGMVLEQTARYNDAADTDGHLYGAILASVRAFKDATETGKYADYHIAFCAHYVGDLSQPLHNHPNDSFNARRHKSNDGIVEDEVFRNIQKIREHMYPIALRSESFEEDAAKEVARIANISRTLSYTLQEENRDMTREEAYKQLGHSASLLKAILTSLTEGLHHPPRVSGEKSTVE